MALKYDSKLDAIAPPDINPRYWAWLILERPKERKGYEYIIWNQGMWRRFEHDRRRPGPHGIDDHAAYDDWLAEMILERENHDED